MAPEPTPHDSTENERNSLEGELKELISALTTRLGSIQRAHNPSSSDEDEKGVGIVTLAGNNVGATMRGDVDDVEQEDLATYVNSNFQAINNSIMMGGSYKTNDPGVHLDISDVYEHDDDDDHQATNKRGKKGSKNLTRRRSKGERHNHHHGKRSDGTSDTNTNES
ncbi:Unknown protein [Striga hermonthica]|uniref:Uncharacterized protein n=1 Tax=Striga hermonthica TaxID=68872 RepID=A0A9N7RBC8_STRHE|nr:Unknown protein [Striga hermonthica]